MLSIEKLNVEYYRGGKTISAVRDFSLAINAGESVGLVGESGSGKSTVALSILRLIRPQEGHIVSGKIQFQGQDLLSLPPENMRDIRCRKIAMIFQDPFTSLNPVMRIREQMDEVLKAHPSLSASPSRLVEALEQVQLESTRVLNSYPHQLSGGQRQRVMIAIALLGQPSLILADEPTTALDVLVQKEILGVLFSLQKKLGLAMLFITHNLGLVTTYTHRIAVMKEGRLVEEGPSQAVFRQPSEAYTRQLLEAIPRLGRSTG